MKTAVFFLSLFLVTFCNAQVPGVRYTKKEMLTYYHEISKFELNNVDTLVDIGSGIGKYVNTVFKFYPFKQYILVDIDPGFKNALGYNVTVKGKLVRYKDHRKFFLGTDSTIPLPSSQFRRVLCRQTFHEFTNPKAMLGEMRRILADDGLLIVEEATPEFKGQTDPNCKHTYWTKEELVEVFESNGFKLVSSDVTMYDEGTADGNLNILKFKKG